MKRLRTLITERKAKVGIIGLGYVGLPLAVEFAGGGFPTTGFEIDGGKVKDINSGKSYIPDVPSAVVRELSKTGKLRATRDFKNLRNQDVVIICVPTPLRKSKDPDVSYILSAAEEVAANMRKGQLVILESTTYPGTTTELVRPLLEQNGFKAGRDFYLSFSPERVDPGNKRFGVKNTPKVVGGATASCTELSALLYSQVVDRVIPVSSSEAAEMVKLLENTFRAVNIAMINEMALMCNRLGLDVWEILDAASSKPFGFMPFYPGPGIGGHCIPLDPHYLGWKMRTLNFEPRFIDLAGVINSSMPEYVVRRTGEILNLSDLPLKKSRVLVIGMAYKPDISDARESPAHDVVSLLTKTGALVDYHDPFVPEITIDGRRLKSRPLSDSSLKGYDCVIIVTPHSSIDYRRVVKRSKLVFDTRNATRGIKSDNIHKL